MDDRQLIAYLIEHIIWTNITRQTIMDRIGDRTNNAIEDANNYHNKDSKDSDKFNSNWYWQDI